MSVKKYLQYPGKSGIIHIRLNYRHQLLPDMELTVRDHPVIKQN